MSQLVLAEFECDETRSRAHRVARKRQAPIVSLAATGSHRGNCKLERECMPTLDRPFLTFGASSCAGFLGGSAALTHRVLVVPVHSSQPHTNLGFFVTDHFLAPFSHLESLSNNFTGTYWTFRLYDSSVNWILLISTSGTRFLLGSYSLKVRHGFPTDQYRD